MFRQDRLPTDPHGMSYLNTFDSQPGKQLNQSHITLAKQKLKHREVSSPPLYWRENLVKLVREADAETEKVLRASVV